MGWWPLPTFPLEPSLWHSHEMVYGFAAGGVAGFLFTAIANWTGRPPLAGTTLVVLFGFWLLARLGYLFPSLIPLSMTILVDIGFVVLLTALAAREVMAVANKTKLYNSWATCTAWPKQCCVLYRYGLWFTNTAWRLSFGAVDFADFNQPDRRPHYPCV